MKRTSRAERLTLALHADARWDKSVREARLELGAGEEPLQLGEQRQWLIEASQRAALFASTWAALRSLQIAPLQQRLLINHWIACFVKYPAYWRNGQLVLTAFRLPANLMKDLPGYFLTRDERFNHTKHDALVVPSAIMAIEFELDGERQPLVVVVDATGFPDPEDARRLLRSPVATELRAAWQHQNPGLISSKRGRPSIRKRTKD